MTRTKKKAAKTRSTAKQPGGSKKAPTKKRASKKHAQRFRDRIVELRRVPASELLKNPLNWRLHPDEQEAALTSIMERIGIAGALVGRDTKQGVEILDGHLRQDIAGDDIVPVLITDLDDKEAALFLATYDPLAELAIMDAEALKVLLEQASGPEDEDAFMRKLFADVEDELASSTETKAAQTKVVEGMALEPHEHYDYLVVACQTSHEFNVLCERLNLKPEKRRARMGTARAIRATRLLEKLHGNS